MIGLNAHDREADSEGGGSLLEFFDQHFGLPPCVDFRTNDPRVIVCVDEETGPEVACRVSNNLQPSVLQTAFAPPMWLGR